MYWNAPIKEITICSEVRIGIDEFIYSAHSVCSSDSSIRITSEELKWEMYTTGRI